MIFPFKPIILLIIIIISISNNQQSSHLINLRSKLRQRHFRQTFHTFQISNISPAPPQPNSNMKFLQIVSLATIALATPSVAEPQTFDLSLDKRGILINGIQSTLDNLKASTTANLGVLSGAAVSIAAPQAKFVGDAVTLVQNNLKSTASSITTAATALQGSVKTVTDGLAASATGLTYAEFEQIKTALLQAQDIITSIRAGVTGLSSGSSGVSAAVLATAKEEIDLVRDSMTQFIAPLQTLAGTVGNVALQGGAQNLAYGVAMNSLAPVIKTLIGAI